MPIDRFDLGAGTLQQVCACCGAAHELRLDTLVLGASPAPGVIAADVILLPACACGVQEALLRTWDTMPEDGRGSVTDKQRRAVNAIAGALKAAGRSQPAAKTMHDAEASAPTDVAGASGAGLLIADAPPRPPEPPPPRAPDAPAALPV